MDPLFAILIGIFSGSAASALISLLSSALRKASGPIKIKIAGVEVAIDSEDPESSFDRIREAALEMAKTPQVVLLYSQEDKELATRVTHDLRQHGVEVWIGDDEIRVGDNIIEKINNAIEASQWVVVVVPPESERKAWMRREMELALGAEKQRARQLILPVVTGKSSIPESLEERAYADFSADYEQGLSSLVESITRSRPPNTSMHRTEQSKHLAAG